MQRVLLVQLAVKMDGSAVLLNTTLKVLLLAPALHSIAFPMEIRTQKPNRGKSSVLRKQTPVAHRRFGTHMCAAADASSDQVDAHWATHACSTGLTKQRMPWPLAIAVGRNTQFCFGRNGSVGKNRQSDPTRSQTQSHINRSNK